MLLALNASQAGMKDELSKNTDKDISDEKIREAQRINSLENDFKILKGNNHLR